MEGRCRFCGKKGRRACPPLEGSICAPCCGARRNREWVCPFRCPYNPFGADYDRLLEIEARFFARVDEFLVTRSEEARRRLARVTGSELASCEAMRRLYFSTELFAGATGLEAFARDEAARKLSGDERLILESLGKARGALLEHQEVVEPPRMRMLDLYADEELIVADRSVSQSLCRYDCFLTLIYPLPHYHRLLPPGRLVPRVHLRPFRASIDGLWKEAREGGDGIELGTFLLRNMERLFSELEAIARAWRESIIENLDLSLGRCLYRIEGDRDRLLAALRSRPDFEYDEERSTPSMESFRWVRRGPSRVFDDEHPELPFSTKDPEGSGAHLATVRVSGDRLAVDTKSRAARDFCTRLIERDFGEWLALEGEGAFDPRERLREAMERTEEAAAEGREEEPMIAPETSPEIPPEVLQKVLQEFQDRHYRRFLDEPVPAIDGWTPRDAARSPAMRPRLVELMKEHLNGHERSFRQKGVRIDITWVLEELGLTELIR